MNSWNRHTDNNIITDITNLGFWILIDQTEYFVPFQDYPAFKNATLGQILNFETFSPKQLYWRSLDCDIETDALENPHHFQLQYK